MIAGATIATTSFPSSISLITGTIKERSLIAPNGQEAEQRPQFIQFSSSILAMLSSS